MPAAPTLHPPTPATTAQGLNWRKVADQQLAEALNDSEEEKRANAQMLSAVFDMDGMDELIESVNGQGTAEKKKLTYFLEVGVFDGAGTEVAKLVAESEDDGLADQVACCYRLLHAAACCHTLLRAVYLLLFAATCCELMRTDAN